MDLIQRMKHVFNFSRVIKVDETEKQVFSLVKVEVDTQRKFTLNFDIDKLTWQMNIFCTASVVFLISQWFNLSFFELSSNIIITVSIESYSILL